MRIKRKAFTLIELLVVIAVIAILAGLLLPSLNKARDRARSITCLSNMKQVGAVMNMYGNDWTDFYPAAYNGNAGNGGMDGYWTTVMINNSYVAQPVVGKASFLVCPSYGDKVYMDNRKTYGMWAGYSGMTDPGCILVGSSWYFQRAKFVNDRPFVLDSTVGDEVANPAWNQSYSIGSGDGSEVTTGNLKIVHLRHSLKATGLFNDGHADTKGEDWFKSSYAVDNSAGKYNYKKLAN